jgi:hypothetical protein
MPRAFGGNSQGAAEWMLDPARPSQPTSGTAARSHGDSARASAGEPPGRIAIHYTRAMARSGKLPKRLREARRARRARRRELQRLLAAARKR